MEEDRDFIEFKNIKFFFHPYHKDYLASKCGKILSLKWGKKKILKLISNERGYLFFNFCDNKKQRIYYAHRFIFEAFKGEIPEGMHTDHIDECKVNNSIFNLQLLTPRENNRKTHCKKVISLDLETQKEITFDSLTEAAKFHQISVASVWRNCNKKTKFSITNKGKKKFQFFYL